MHDQNTDVVDEQNPPEEHIFNILVVDDEPNILRVYQKTLESENYSVVTTNNGKEALQKIGGQFFDLVIADLSMPEMDGIELLQKVHKIDPDLPYIIVTGHGTVKSAVTAMKEGAEDFLTKPFDRSQMLMLVARTLNRDKLKRELRTLKGNLLTQFGLENMVGKSRPMMKLFDITRKVSLSEATIHIEGESGTGKELLAKSIHFNSRRKDNPLVIIDCASLPLELLQSELFGHVKGSFTGAIQNRRGLFEEARGGTIFLDEVGEIPSALQLSLLRVLQEREIRPVGSDKPVPVDVRIISASNTKLKDAVDRGDFRLDLYFRLAVITLEIPPLRNRSEDIPTLCRFFLQRYNERNHKNIQSISPAVMNAFLKYHWEGNVRELENIIERAVVLAEGDELTLELLPDEMREKPGSGIELKLPDEDLPLKEICARASSVMEQEAILNALKKSGGNKKKAAELLGISRGSLYNKMNEYKILEIK